MADGCGEYAKLSAARYKFALFLWSLSALLCTAYFLGAMARSGVAFEPLSTIPKPFVVFWKGFAEALLVVAVCFTAQSRVARKLAFTVFVIVIADIFLAVGNLPLAGSLFIFAHLLAMSTYLRLASNSTIEPRTKLLSLMPFFLVIVLVLWAIQAGKFQILIVFPVFSALAAFGALRSTYPRLLNGLGAIMIWISDMVFVLAILLWADATSVGWLVWLSFSSGLLLITRGLLISTWEKSVNELKP